MLTEDKALRMYAIGDMASFQMYLMELTPDESLHLAYLMREKHIPYPYRLIRRFRKDVPVTGFPGSGSHSRTRESGKAR